MFIRARPLHADGAPDRPRQDRRVGGGVLMAVHAIAPRAFQIDQAHLVLGQAKESGEGGAIVMRALGRGPHRGLVGTHVGDRAGRTEGGVLLAGKPEVMPWGGAPEPLARRAGPGKGFAEYGVGRGLLGGGVGSELGVELAAAERAGKTRAGPAALRPTPTAGGDEVFRL